MYGSKPDIWSDELRGYKRLRFIVNSFTRMRFCRPDGSLDFTAKARARGLRQRNCALVQNAGPRKASRVRIVFGHWSTLGYLEEKNVLSLDTGCVWGGRLTAAQTRRAHTAGAGTSARQPRRG